MYDDAYKPGGGTIVPATDLEERKAETRVAVREVFPALGCFKP